VSNIKIELKKADCLDFLASIPESSVDLIATDPPYFRVKDNDWDRQWRNQGAFFSWLDQVLIEYQRVLRPQGSIYLFAGPHLATQVDIAVSRHFRMLNHIVWCKPSGRHNGCRKEALRKYFPQTEHIMFAESVKDNGGIRRHFSVNKQVPFTNVWHFKPVAWYRGKHPCEKPADLMEHIITASSQSGDTVLDTFVGSGSTPIVCKRLGRNFIGCERGDDEYHMAIQRIAAS
jgi:DNA modification methylase